jgi:HlyD family secretion protein
MVKRWPAYLFLAVVAAGVVWLFARRTAPPEVPFAKTRREKLVSLISTNGKVEAASWEVVSPEREGRVARVLVHRGDAVKAGQALVTLEDSSSQEEVAAAEARVASAQAILSAVDQGGTARERTEITAALAKVNVDIAAATKDTEVLQRLVEKQAATPYELLQARERLARAEAERDTLLRRRETLVVPSDRTVAEARLREAQESLRAARVRAAQATLRAPIDGVVYELDARPGDWLTPATPAARIGRTATLRIILHVDEPDLGRVREGQPVRITWDAFPNRAWSARVEKVPSQVIVLGSRMVGEVLALADNADGALLIGANIIAEIRAQEVDNALTIPKEALRRVNAQTGVFLLEGERLRWRPLTLGISNVTRAQVTSGLSDGASVALPTDLHLSDGLPVRAVYP